MQQLSRYKIIALLTVWTLSLLAAIILFNLVPMHDTQFTAPISSLNRVFSKYRYVGKNNSTVPTIVFIGPRQLVDYLDLKIRFRINKYSPYANIFQTSSFNEGIRLELVKSSDMGIGAILIIGDFIEKNPKVVKILDKLIFEKEYTLEIRTDNWDHMLLYLDGEIIHTMAYSGRAILSNCIIGNGFDGTRPFLGEVTLDKLDIYVSSTLDSTSKGLVRRIVDLLRLKNQQFLLGLFTVMVNILAMFRILYFVWYEP